MKQISTKQAQRNREIAKIKENLPSYCVICGKPAVDAAHLVPKSMYPEHYTNPLNIVGLCGNVTIGMIMICPLDANKSV